MMLAFNVIIISQFLRQEWRSVQINQSVYSWTRASDDAISARDMPINRSEDSWIHDIPRASIRLVVLPLSFLKFFLYLLEIEYLCARSTLFHHNYKFS